MDTTQTLFTNTDTALKQGDCNLAKKILEKIINIENRNIKARTILIQVLLRLNKLNQAESLLDETLLMTPNDPNLWFYHGKLKKTQKKQHEAVKSLIRSRAEIKIKSPLIILICNELLELGQAKIVWDIIPAEEESDLYHIRIIRAKTLILLGAPLDAKIHLLKADAQENLTIGDRFYLWQEAKKTSFLDVEVSFFKKFLALKKISYEDDLFLADIYLKNKELIEANEILDKLLNEANKLSSPEYIKALVLSSRCATLQGHKETAKKHLLTAYKNSPSSTEILESMIDYASPELLIEFKSLYTNSIQTLSQLSLPEKKNRLMVYARIAEKNNDFTQAFSFFQKSNEIEKNILESDPIKRFDITNENNIVNKIISEFPDLPFNPAKIQNKTMPIFILGMPRSGTTLIERILGEYEDVKTKGENISLNQVVQQKNWDTQYQPNSPIKRSSVDWEHMREQYLKISNIQEEKKFTDKMPFNYRHIGNILGMFPNAPIIHIRRDPRDVCWSIYTRFFNSEHSYSADLNSILHKYAACERLMNHWKSIAPDKILTINYEQFVNNPEIESKRMAEFCHLKWEPTCLNFHKNNTASYTSSELQVREPLNTKGIGRWRKYEMQLSSFLNSVEQSDMTKFRFN